MEETVARNTNKQVSAECHPAMFIRSDGLRQGGQLICWALETARDGRQEVKTSFGFLAASGMEASVSREQMARSRGCWVTSPFTWTLNE